MREEKLLEYNLRLNLTISILKCRGRAGNLGLRLNSFGEAKLRRWEGDRSLNGRSVIITFRIHLCFC